jgi:hypothetical protein
MPNDRQSSLKPPRTDWRELAKRAAVETDPEELSQLIEQLCDALEETCRQNPRQPNPSPPENPKPGPLR